MPILVIKVQNICKYYFNPFVIVPKLNLILRNVIPLTFSYTKCVGIFYIVVVSINVPVLVLGISVTFNVGKQLRSSTLF